MVNIKTEIHPMTKEQPSTVHVGRQKKINRTHLPNNPSIRMII